SEYTLLSSTKSHEFLETFLDEPVEGGMITEGDYKYEYTVYTRVDDTHFHSGSLKKYPIWQAALIKYFERKVCSAPPTSNAFPVEIESTKTIGDLRDLIKTKKTPEFDDIAADKLILWRVTIPITDDDNEIPILLNNVTSDKKKLGPATRLSKVFPEELPEETIHIIVQRPPPGNADALYPSSGYYQHCWDDIRR
ncbi:hypothetical protein BG000_000894, partial [Podila horticola]